MRSTIALALPILLAACGGESASATAPKVAAAETTSASLEKAPDSGQVDRVGPDDGALKPDGIKDLSLRGEGRRSGCCDVPRDRGRPREAQRRLPGRHPRRCEREPQGARRQAGQGHIGPRRRRGGQDAERGRWLPRGTRCRAAQGHRLCCACPLREGWPRSSASTSSGPTRAWWLEALSQTERTGSSGAAGRATRRKRPRTNGRGSVPAP